MSDVTGGSLVASSSTQRANRVFNLRDEKNALSLLRQIHQSPISPDDKNELRDAVFVFRNNPSTEITPEFTAKFSEYGFTLGTEVASEVSNEVPAPEPAPETAAVRTFGATRPSPQFSSFTVQPVIEVATKEIPAAPVMSEVQTEPVTPEEQAPAVPEVEPVPVAVPEPVATPSVSEPVVPVAAAPKVVSSPSVSVAPERIKEIKKEVNQLVGNPVNLIDVNNEVGREYMNALLDAMKKNNGGTPEEVERAMTRLETSFVAVTQAVGDAKTLPVQESKEVPVPTADVISETVQDLSPAQEKEVLPSVPEIPPSEELEKKETPVSGFTSVHQSHVQDVPTTPKESVEVGVLSPVQEEVPAEVKKEIETILPKVPEIAPENNAGGIMSVAKEKQIQDLMTTQKQEAAVTDQQKKEKEIAAMDPLMTPEVTNGLQQLLSEWTLFKSSGIFGTGPSGMEHPLYIKLSKLNMTAVVAGRYEGATPQIKRSITDYMNGWRYEEGIMQEQGELFEHYLRRVIKHILDKRK